MPVCSLAIRSIRVRGKPQTLARAPADILSGTRNSSRRTSPGCIGLSFLVIVASLLMVVYEFDLRRALRGLDADARPGMTLTPPSTADRARPSGWPRPAR